MPRELYNYVDVLYNIDEGDVPHIQGSQWYTRMLYNAYPPFKINYVLDSHVFPCDSTAATELFYQFNNSNVDIAIANRVNTPGYYMGGGILFRANEKTRAFWKSVYDVMIKNNNTDDQFGIGTVMSSYHNNYPFNYRQLSFNWLFASHGINEKGVFYGPGNCYRSSVPVNGKIRFVHGNPTQCNQMNGENGEYESVTRVYFLSSMCNTTRRGFHVITSLQQFQQTTHPYPTPSLNWTQINSFSRYSIFW